MAAKVYMDKKPRGNFNLLGPALPVMPLVTRLALGSNLRHQQKKPIFSYYRVVTWNLQNVWSPVLPRIAGVS